EAAVLRARREAVLSTSFGPIIHSLRGARVNQGAIRLRLQSDHNVPEGSSEAVATVLVESAEQAGLLREGSFDAAAIEDLADVLPSAAANVGTEGSKVAQASGRGGRSSTSAGGRGDPAKPATPGRTAQKDGEEDMRPLAASGVQVVVNVDAS